ncbi:hypothetical protein [Aestuariivirga sp.]|uniref:hypothetical protein n=1 Tax=Aestuariivirga sp. TaxID=2650926 RepID=UPI0039E466B1
MSQTKKPLLRLNELHARYLLAIGYIRPGGGHLTQNPFAQALDRKIGEMLDTDISSAAFTGKLKFQGSRDLSRATNMSGASRNQRNLEPVSEIPQSYFAIPRGISPTKLLSYSDAQMSDVGFETLHPSPRHPDFEMVLVDGDTVDDFLLTVKHFASDLPGVKAILPDWPKYSLCQAVTALALGHPVESSGIAQFLDPTYEERSSLAQSALEERATSEQYSHFPDELPTTAVAYVHCFMDGRVPKPWPPSAERLHRLASSQAERELADGRALETASAAIYGALRFGRISASGRRSKGGKVEQIPLEHFKPLLTINWLFDTIHPADIFADNRFEWEEVALDGPSYRHWMDVVREQGNSPTERRDFSTGAKSDDENAGSSFSDEGMKQSRWSLITTLVWISTRDVSLASKTIVEHRTLHRTDIRLDLVDQFAQAKGLTSPVRKTLSDAWQNELAPALAKSSLTGFATKTEMMVAGGVQSSVAGVPFPPENQRGLALTYRPFDAQPDGIGGIVLRPENYTLAQSWTEYRELSFAREEIVSIWPPTMDEKLPVPTSPTVPVVLAHRRPDQLNAALAYLERADAMPADSKITALVEDMKSRTGHSVSFDTMRRARHKFMKAAN